MMIRKGTWIVLIVFAALLGLAFYLQKNPLPDTSEATPSATAEPMLLEGWSGSDITYIELKGESGTTSLTKNPDGSWTLGPEDARPASIEQVQNITTQLVTVRLMSVLDTASPIDALGLVTPVNVLTLRNTQGEEVTIKIGAQTPTGSGYYVQIGSGAPAILRTTTVESVLGMMTKEQLAAPTATVESNESVEETPSLIGTATP